MGSAEPLLRIITACASHWHQQIDRSYNGSGEEHPRLKHGQVAFDNLLFGGSRGAPFAA
jgi:hypothetical protein